MLKSKTTGAIVRTKTANWNRATGDWIIDGGQLLPDPKQDYEVIPEIPLIGPIAFQILFSIQEAVDIDAAKATDPAVRIFWKLLDDPRTDTVDRNLEPVQGMITHLEDVKLIAPGRAQQIIHA